MLWQRHRNYCLLPPSLSNFFRRKIIFLHSIGSIDENFLSGNDSRISKTLLFGISLFKDPKNTSILNTAIDYILSTKRFDDPLTNFRFVLKHLCIENMSFKFYSLNFNFFTKFLCWFRHIAFTLPCQLGFPSNYHYFYDSISTAFILFVCQYLSPRVKKLAQVTPQTSHI